MIQQTAELVLNARASVGEGPIWANGVLYWVDITEGAIHIFDPTTGKDRGIYLGQMIGTVVAREKGGVAVSAQEGFGVVDLETGVLKILHDPEANDQKSRFNDGKCDPAGRFWAGSCPMSEETATGTLYRMDANHSVHAMVDGLTIANGIVWNHEKDTMYYIDTPTQQVDAFDYDHASGDVANRRLAFEIPVEMGWPDGMTIDEDGNLWIGMWGGHAVTVWNPKSGEYLGKIEVAASQVTACAFGGPDLDTLYITSARRDLKVEDLKSQPHAGGLFQVKPGVRGVPSYAFAG